MKYILFILSILVFPQLGQSWAEDALAKMSLEEKIGQLFIAPACPLRGEDHWNDWLSLINQYHIGAAIMKQGTLEEHVRLVNRLQKASPLPLLITADAEYGLAQCISDAIAYPRNAVLGKTNDLHLIHDIGKQIGAQCKQAGIHLNFSPVADVNNNPGNIIIGARSFGDDPDWVAQCVVAMFTGLQEGGVMACAKHFPGHGDTSVDSHANLPIILHSRDHIENTELIPFKAAIENGVKAIMSAHILVPCIDEKLPCTLSANAMHKLLRIEMGFDGLIITDALNMKALVNLYTDEEIALYAHMAGCDLLLYGDHIAPNVDEIIRKQIPSAFNRLKRAYENDELSIDFLNEKVLRILRAKESLLHSSF